MTIDEVRAAAAVLRDVVHRTPITTSESLSARFGGRLWCKAEHLQRTGSFKIRGAYVRIASLTDAERSRGVIAASAGNHAQGVAWAATRLGVEATIVMPVYASLPKVEATRGYGATVMLEGDDFHDALAYARLLASERDLVLVHAYDDPLVIAGQGTVGLEVAEDAPHAARVLVPFGGGGLLAGTAVAVKALMPSCEVIGVRAAATPATIADGAAVKEPGSLTGEIVEALVDDIVEVDEEAISEAIVLHLERSKQVVEGAGALGLAALVSGAVAAGDSTVLVVSGGNIDPGLLMRVIRHGLSTAGRYLFVRLRLPDRPGQLRRVLTLLADQLVNVVSVVHHRAGLTMPVDEVEVELTLETRDRAHADDVLRSLESAGYRPSL